VRTEVNFFKNRRGVVSFCYSYCVVVVVIESILLDDAAFVWGLHTDTGDWLWQDQAQSLWTIMTARIKYHR